MRRTAAPRRRRRSRSPNAPAVEQRSERGERSQKCQNPKIGEQSCVFTVKVGTPRTVPAARRRRKTRQRERPRDPGTGGEVLPAAGGDCPRGEPVSRRGRGHPHPATAYRPEVHT